MNDEPSEALSLLFLVSLGLSGAAFIAFLTICGGCLASLAVPLASSSRSWLAASIALLLIGCLALIATFTMAMIGAVELQLEGEIAAGVMQLLLCCFLAAGALGLLTAVSHAGFLRKLAVYLGNERTARSAAGLQFLLLIASPVFAVGLCLLPFAAVDGSPSSTVLGLAALLVFALLLGWWLALVNAVRSSVRLGLWPLR